MATQFFGISRGGQLKDVTTGTSTTGKNVEITVNDAVGLKQSDVDVLVETLQQFIYNQRTTPFAQ